MTALVGLQHEPVPRLGKLVKPFEKGKGQLPVADIGGGGGGIEQALGILAVRLAQRPLKQCRCETCQFGSYGVRQAPVLVDLLGEAVQAVDRRQWLAWFGQVCHAQRLRKFAGVGEALPAALQQPRVRPKDGTFVYHDAVRRLRLRSTCQRGNGGMGQRLHGGI